jgi:hypothetical protein
MSRSKHTRPRHLRAHDRVRDPHEPRGADDPSRLRRQARLLKELGAWGEPAQQPDELPARLPRLCVQRPRPGHCHPAGRADLLRVLEFFGPVSYYGLRTVTLARAPARSTGLLLGRLVVPGRILLYEQPVLPWSLTQPLTTAEADRLRQAGADVEEAHGGTRWVVSWPGDSLRDFMLLDVFLHEVGHHVVQQYTGKRSARVARTSDHEAVADNFARRCRLAFQEEQP